LNESLSMILDLLMVSFRFFDVKAISEENWKEKKEFLFFFFLASFLDLVLDDKDWMEWEEMGLSKESLKGID